MSSIKEYVYGKNDNRSLIKPKYYYKTCPICRVYVQISGTTMFSKELNRTEKDIKSDLNCGTANVDVLRSKFAERFTPKFDVDWCGYRLVSTS